MKKLKTILSTIIILSLFVSCAKTNNSSQNDTNKGYKKTGNEISFSDFDENLGDNIPIIRGEVAKIVALTFSESNEFDNITATINFEDLKEDDVYYKYATLCSNKGYMKGDGKSFRAYDELTLNEAYELLELINPNSKSKIALTDDNKNKPISYGLWSELFVKSLDELSSGKIYEKYKLINKSPIILATNKDNTELLDYIITDVGKVKATNLDLSNFRDTKINIYEKNGEIVLLRNSIDKTPTIENAYLYSYTKDKITIFSGGVYRSYKIVNGKENDINGSICNIKINGDTAQSISVFKENQSEKVRLIDGSTIRLSNNKSYTLDDNFKIYGNYGNTLTFENKKNIRVGAYARFVTKDDKILAGIFDEDINIKRIRVLLNDTSYKNTVHKSVTVSSDTGFILNDKSYAPNEQLTVSEDNYKSYIKDDFIEIKPNEGGMITVNSIERANKYNPKYRGVIEISKVSGGFYVVSDVTFDEYLYQVVPSEMPSRYGEGASQVQAICARTYAYKQYYKGAFEKFGANVDDSTSCQVYNNIGDNQTSINAVNATTGQIIVYNNQPVDAFFFSTSGGSTASAGDVWTTDIKNFPKGSEPYLTAKSEHNEGDIDLSVEENADKFFKDTKVSAIEEDVDWFRWNFTLQRDELSTSINNNLKERYSKRPDLILTKQADGNFKSTPVDSVGLVKDIKVVKRGAGGNVIIMDIFGTDNTVRVYSEYNTRALLRPYQYINGKDKITLNMVGTSMKNYSLMPSSFFTMDISYDENKLLKSVTFYGGGNGHAVGLSQNGSAKLLEQGMSVTEVIEHYYKGSKVTDISKL